MTLSAKISPLGDGALTIELGTEISLELNNSSVALADMIASDPFPGLIETVPAYSSVAVFYNMREVRDAFPEFTTAFEALRSLVTDLLERQQNFSNPTAKVVEIPVDFSESAGMDLEAISEHCGLNASDVIDVFLSQTYRVYMLGFLPGFAYMGTVDERIAIPRRSSPRKVVPKGSVGIAGQQTGIYPSESPGGWQIIGRTHLEMFTPNGDTPCLLRPGDEVRFVNGESLIVNR